jgi:hypothetical protein
MRVLKSAGLFVLIAIAVVGVSVGAYQGIWWLIRSNTDRGAVINRENYNSQQTYIDKVAANRHDISVIDTQLQNPTITADQKAALENQRAAIIDEGCQIASRVSLPDSSVTSFKFKYCDPTN